KDELQNNIEMAMAEFEKAMAQTEQKKAETPEKLVEVAKEKPKSEKKPSADVQPKKKQPTKPTNPPKGAEPAKRVQKDYTPDVNAPKTKLVGLVLVILSLIGLIAIINAVVSAVGGGKSANEDIKNAVYPAVIMDISTFDNASQLSDDQIISATIWSVVMDKEKLSKYTQRANDMIVIPSADVSQYAIDLFGEEIPALTHTTVTTAEEKFYYNAETDCYNIQAQPDAHTYSPEVKDVSKHGKDYTVDVEYIEEHAEWIDKSVAKTVRFELTKTSNGYRINSMELIG
ncbi:MAG: hypothetical protein K2J08_10785, partial [Ruminococcus sp.]|nr:hypothetical protein [Ruminococcus sp.]